MLCDRLVPGYYKWVRVARLVISHLRADVRARSPSMFGTVLDQKVFESLVHRCLPVIQDHFATVDVQLSMASLPWFLSLYINSMPLVFAFRVVDCFFLSECSSLVDKVRERRDELTLPCRVNSGTEGSVPDWSCHPQDQRR